MTSLRERTTHETTDPTRSENRMSHRIPPSVLCAPFYTVATRPGGVWGTEPQVKGPQERHNRRHEKGRSIVWSLRKARSPVGSRKRQARQVVNQSRPC